MICSKKQNTDSPTQIVNIANLFCFVVRVKNLLLILSPSDIRVEKPVLLLTSEEIDALSDLSEEEDESTKHLTIDEPMGGGDGKQFFNKSKVCLAPLVIK